MKRSRRKRCKIDRTNVLHAGLAADTKGKLTNHRVY
jgi:hypothetical protein